MESDDRKQWNEAAYSWVEFVRSGKNYYSEYLNGPALRRVIGDVEGKKVLDMAVVRVTAQDFSQRLALKSQASTSVKP